MKHSIHTIITILILGLLSIETNNSYAYQSLSIPVSIPVHGNLVFAGNLVEISGERHQLFIADAYSGMTQLIAESELFSFSPVWNQAGSKIAYLSGNNTEIFDLLDGTVDNLDILAGKQAQPVGWDAQSEHLLFVAYDYSESTQTSRYDLQILNITNGAVTPLLSYNDGEVLANLPLPALPSGVTQLQLYDITQAAWNPVYSDWIAIQIIGFTPEINLSEQGQGATFPITFVYNLQTGQMTSLDQLFSDRISRSPIKWSSDGKSLVLETEGQGADTHIVRLNSPNDTPTLVVVEDGESADEVVIDWLNAGDLLVTAERDTSNGDTVYYIAQIINDTWHSTEFLRLPATTFSQTGDVAWHITADESEKQTLSCFFDQALPTRLSVALHARVNFTDGSPLRLRQEPDVYSAEIQQMPEGTEFDVVNGPFCRYGYRWWQLDLGNNIIGWAAEADETEYFIEPNN